MTLLSRGEMKSQQIISRLFLIGMRYRHVDRQCHWTLHVDVSRWSIDSHGLEDAESDDTDKVNDPRVSTNLD